MAKGQSASFLADEPLVMFTETRQSSMDALVASKDRKWPVLLSQRHVSNHRRNRLGGGGLLRINVDCVENAVFHKRSSGLDEVVTLSFHSF